MVEGQYARNDIGADAHHIHSGAGVIRPGRIVTDCIATQSWKKRTGLKARRVLTRDGADLAAAAGGVQSIYIDSDLSSVRMKRDLMEILCCPVCKGDLGLKVDVEKDEIIEGSLFCKKCKYRYEIKDGIPNLLPPDFK